MNPLRGGGALFCLATRVPSQTYSLHGESSCEVDGPPWSPYYPPMSDPEVNPAILQRLDEFLAGKGLRRTKQREVIIHAAFSTTEHFTADELWAMARKLDPTTSRATLYRTLLLLVESGLLREID